MSLHDLLAGLPKMDGLRWLPFDPSHYLMMDIKAQNVQAVSQVTPIKQMLQWQAAHGDAITAVLHDRPVAVFGSIKIWHGVEQIWMLCEERARKYPIVMTKAGRMFVLHRVIAGNLHRIQATVRCDDLRAHRWAESLGLLDEGVMFRYGPDKMDYWMMART